MTDVSTAADASACARPCAAAAGRPIAEWFGARGNELRPVNRTNAAYSGRGGSQTIDVESVRRPDPDR